MSAEAPELADQRWDEVDARTVLVPVGSTEQHGPHLPFDADTVVADAVARGLAARLAAAGTRTVVAPALAYGASGEHQDFAGTASIGSAALELVLVELGRSLSTWARAIVFVNGHGGNVEAVRRAVDLLRAEGRDADWVPCAAPGMDAHAGRAETSMLLHLAPARVRPERAAAGRTEPIGELIGELRERGVRAVSPNGVLGDPRGASAEEGGRLLEETIALAFARLGAGRPTGGR